MRWAAVELDRPLREIYTVPDFPGAYRKACMVGWQPARIMRQQE